MTAADFRAARKRLKLTQAEMAERIGRSRSQVNLYEAGKADVPPIVAKLVRMMLAAAE